MTYALLSYEKKEAVDLCFKTSLIKVFSSTKLASLGPSYTSFDRPDSFDPECKMAKVKKSCMSIIIDNKHFLKRGKEGLKKIGLLLPRQDSYLIL